MANAKKVLIATGQWRSETTGTVYTRADAIREGRSMTYLAKGKMRTTKTA